MPKINIDDLEKYDENYEPVVRIKNKKVKKFRDESKF